MSVFEKIKEKLEEKCFNAELYNNDFDGQTVNNLLCLGDVTDVIDQIAEEYTTVAWQVIYSKVLLLEERYAESGDIDNVNSCIKLQNLMQYFKEELRESESAEQLNRWIPVAERFPKDDKYILLSFSNFTIPMIGRYEEDEEGGAFYLGDEDETCVSQDLFVNAWMPLPECYKEE